MLNQKQQQLEADLAKKERERLEEMRKREQNRIMEVNNITKKSELSHENLSLGFPNRPDTKPAVQPQKMASSLNFLI